MMGLDKYGLIVAAAFLLLGLAQNLFFFSQLAKSREKRVEEAKKAGRPPPNDTMLRLLMLPGTAVLAYVGYVYLGPELASAMEGN